jgi:tripartite-type tricarboxylate transporter receptor subunit TctC
LAGLVLLCANAQAQTAVEKSGASAAWPAKPVRVIAPFLPGGSADTLGRLVSAKLTESLGQNFVVENRAGAGGVVGSDSVAKSAPDGYTLLVSGVASHVVAPVISRVPYHPLKDFTHIALIGGPPAVLAVHPSLPAKDLKGFIALAKSKPGQLTYGSPGNGTQGHLVAELFKRASGIDIRHVPYKGASVAVVDVLAGYVDSLSTTLTTAGTQIRGGRLRGLAVSSAQRLSAYSQIPTYREQGYSQLVATVWFSISGPAGMPSDIVNRLNSDIRRVLQLPDVRERLHSEGIDAGTLDVKAFNAFVAAEIERWTPVVKASGARAD